jgi:OOP family OmpA-OmpF porin
MRPADDRHLRRYRRRILGWGAALLVLVVAVGAVVTLPRVEDDLADRVEAELDDAGYPAVTATFSGQDGTLDCSSPLPDDAGLVAVAALAREVRGVRSIDVTDACRPDPEPPGSDPEPPGSDVEPGSEVEPDVSSVVPSSAPVSTPPSSTTTVPEAGDTIVDVVADLPSFSQLQALIEFAELGETLAGDGPFTLLAPTDDAFDAAAESLGADAFAQLFGDRDLVERIVLDHVLPGRASSTELAERAEGSTGVELETLGGDAIRIALGPDLTFAPVDASDGTVVAGIDAPGDLDIDATNGVVHGINQVMIPPEIIPAPPAAAPVVAATWDAGLLELVGSVRTAAQQARLTAAVDGTVDEQNVAVDVAVDGDAVLSDDEVDRLGALIGPVVPDLVSGELAIVDGTLRVVGIPFDDGAAGRIAAAAGEADAVLDLDPLPLADDVSASALEDEVNALVTDPDQRIEFQPAGADLAAGNDPLLDRVAVLVRSLDGISVTVVGHTDSEGTAANNLVLSRRRAESVAAALVDRGVAAAVVEVEGRGESDPVIDPATGREDRAASRRVEFVVRAEVAG